MKASVQVCKYDKSNASTYAWTSISDTIVNGKPSREYLQTEKRYLAAVAAALCETDTRELYIASAEVHIKSGRRLTRILANGTARGNDIFAMVRSCLREDIWCKLESPHLCVHFGYDYYMYLEGDIGSDALYQYIAALGLVADPGISSPHMTVNVRDHTTH